MGKLLSASGVGVLIGPLYGSTICILWGFASVFYI